MSEKNEKPTAKRIRDAREEGQVAVSQDLGILVQSGVMLMWLMVEGPALYRALADDVLLAIAVGQQPLERALAEYASHLGWLWVRFFFGMAAALALTLALTGMLQTGFLFAPKALAFKPERLNPIANAKNLVSMKTLFELVKSSLKVWVLGITFAYLIKRYGPSFAHLSQADLAAGFSVCRQMLLWMWAVLLAAGAVFTVADLAMQRYQLLKQLRMSRKDIEQEHKSSEGDPELKQRRRELHREVQSGSLAADVAQASVVVRNPTHIAVCLRYVQGETPLPQVVAQGRNHRARRIVELAEHRGIPVIEQVTLARALFRLTNTGDYVPEPLFAAVAEVLRQAMALMEAVDG
ncbi:EscU/YscU/HrcU family type III secretion system export apparatus switch protein [Paludibacterium sp.]|uniref:EscU/YscU/HrcU family type III secretion system export apparatus switch protein n=1 Tax=Paludibacterium sp. TaxID=1917523 RepID=UPI0025DF8C68|nr:EscU/YscU/HrcU family type III secretion system export apparatus switch protein [Paludibacterium sp.]MBV8646357.1 EscU/YscU/HrcU family type III secretion system export apparatus switch protein [Paludibacterium sp.]